MTTIFLVVLFIMQVVSFYIIALLYMKVSKFDDLEKKQNRLMKEMEDAMAVYLAEIKDDNERLVEKLTVPVRLKQDDSELIKERVEKESPPIHTPIQMPQQTMRHHARKSYETMQQNNVVVDDDVEEVIETVEAVDERSQAIKLATEGLSIEEIAKKLDKGRTEVELILKFK